jgi:formylmethanofuran dehydrogenase subunit E
MPVFEKYCDKCGEPSKQLKNMNGRMLCPKCRGLHFEDEEDTTRKQKLRKMWGV